MLSWGSSKSQYTSPTHTKTLQIHQVKSVFDYTPSCHTVIPKKRKSFFAGGLQNQHPFEAEFEQSLVHKYYLKAMVSKVFIAHTVGVHLNHH